MLSIATLTIDLDALASNHRAIAEAVGGAEVAPVVKADAYGLGMEPVARRLWAEGARTFFVARLEGGERLRALLGQERSATIYVLDGATPGSIERLRAAGLIPVLNSLEQAEAWRAGAAALPAALHVDTGMNRLGVRPDEAEAAGRGLSLLLVISHLACGSEASHAMNAVQLSAFRAVRGLFPEAQASLANSAGSFLETDYAFDLVRPGIALYGGGPFERPDARIQTVATLEAPILQVRDVRAGESVGYGGSFVAERAMRVATVGIGYADGVLRSNSGRGAVWFEGALRPMVGRVSMDLLAVDVSDCPAAKPGDAVQLFGPERPLDEAAVAAGTAAYELLTRIGPRVRRAYRGAIS